MSAQRRMETGLAIPSVDQVTNYHNPFAMTTRAQIQAHVRPYICTCTFAEGRIAVVNIYGASSQEHACAVVGSLWHPIRYRVEAGDSTHGYAHPFTVILQSVPPELGEMLRGNST